MTKTEYITRADQTRVTNVLSSAVSRTMPCEEDDPFEDLTPEKVEDMGFPLAWLQDVQWETYNGVYGPRTLLKEVETGTETCPECDGEGWKDQHGDTLCRECGLVLNHTPEVVAQDSYDWMRGGNTEVGSYGVFFNDGTGGKVALNTARQGTGSADNQRTAPEPNVQ
jgi:hypothetical protein